MTRSLTLTKLQGVCKTLFDKSNKKQARSVDLVALFLTVFMFATWATADPERYHREMMQPGCNGYQDLRHLLRGIDSLYNYIQHLSGIEGYSVPNLVFSKEDATQAYATHTTSHEPGAPCASSHRTGDTDHQPEAPCASSQRTGACSLPKREPLASSMDAGAVTELNFNIDDLEITATHARIARRAITLIPCLRDAYVVDVQADTLCTIRVFGVLQLILTGRILDVDALESKLTETTSVVSAAREAVELAESQDNTFRLELRNLSQGIRALEKDSHVSESNYGYALSVAMNAGAILVSIAVSTEEHTRGSATCQIYMPYSVKGALMPTRARCTRCTRLTTHQTLTLTTIRWSETQRGCHLHFQERRSRTHCTSSRACACNLIVVCSVPCAASVWPE